MAFKNNFDIPPLHYITPELFEKHLDSCIEINAGKFEVGDVVTVNYRTLFPPQKKEKWKIQLSEICPLQIEEDIEEKSKETIQEIEAMAYIGHSTKWKHLLKHPVISSFLSMKWHRLRWFLYTNFVICVAFVISLIPHIKLFYSQHIVESNKTKKKEFMGCCGYC